MDIGSKSSLRGSNGTQDREKPLVIASDPRSGKLIDRKIPHSVL